MTIINEPFQRTKLDEERAKEKRVIITVSFNLEEYRDLLVDMKTLEQPKDGTALKTLWKVGRNVLHDNQTGLILRGVLSNFKKNHRMGIVDAATEIDAKVRQNKPQV